MCNRFLCSMLAVIGMAPAPAAATLNSSMASSESVAASVGSASDSLVGSSRSSVVGRSPESISQRTTASEYTSLRPSSESALRGISGWHASSRSGDMYASDPPKYAAGAAPLHVTPALLLPGQPLEQPDGAPPHRELAVAEVLDHHRGQQHGQVAWPWVSAKGHLFEQQGTGREQQPAAEGQQQEGAE